MKRFRGQSLALVGLAMCLAAFGFGCGSSNTTDQEISDGQIDSEKPANETVTGDEGTTPTETESSPGEDAGFENPGGDADTGTEPIPDESGLPETGDGEASTDNGSDSGSDNGPTLPLYVATGDPMAMGALSVKLVEISAATSGAPYDMHIYVPQGPTTNSYAVVDFQHGFNLQRKYYGDVLTHLASHGFVVVAPQMCSLIGSPSCFSLKTTDEANQAKQVLDWISNNLESVAQVQGRMNLLGIAGHSRGGKVGWRMLKMFANIAKGYAGIDPVDNPPTPAGPSTDEAVTGPVDYQIPMYILGTGKGPVVSSGQACAPAGENHEKFYTNCPTHSWNVVATDFGHADIVDEADVGGCLFLCSACVAGTGDKAKFRQLVGGHLAAFFRASLQGDTASFDVLTNTTSAPVAITAQKK